MKKITITIALLCSMHRSYTADLFSLVGEGNLQEIKRLHKDETYLFSTLLTQRLEKKELGPKGQYILRNYSVDTLGQALDLFQDKSWRKPDSPAEKKLKDIPLFLLEVGSEVTTQSSCRCNRHRRRHTRKASGCSTSEATKKI